MAEEIAEIGPLQSPGEIVESENASRYEMYQPDGIYEYALHPNGKPNKSRAKITYNHGDIYDGNLKRGKYEGEGKYFWKDGGHYEGNFHKGALSGNGKYTALNGDVYEGNFKNSKYDGDGKYTWADGSCFEGRFKNGQILSGKYIDASGNIYTCKYTYNRQGERKNGDIRLIRFARKDTKKTITEPKKIDKTEKTKKSGLLSKDEKLLTAIRKSKRGAEFKNLYSGAAGKNEKAEKSLIAILNFFTNSDAEQIKRIFKTSQIYDKTKGDEHLTDMITGVIKRGKDFTAAAKAGTKSKQNAASAAKGATK